MLHYFHTHGTVQMDEQLFFRTRAAMRYVVTESFDKSEVNKYFEADIAPAIGKTIKSRTGKWYRVQDVACYTDDVDEFASVRVLLKRIR